ncbi:MAG: CRISPR-associated RAMP protein Csx7, partial [Candidatus Bathyarchaeia archaeon]
MGNYKTPGYHIFSRRVRLRGTITLLTGLHIGAGRTIGTSGSDLPVLKDLNGSPFIPGSSLKGVLRSNTEAFLRSFQGSTKTYLTCCQVGGDENSKDPASRPCITRDEKEKLCKQKNADALIWQKSCWVCQFFGSPWIASKVHFMDLFLTSPWANELLSIRDGVAIERDSETAAP